MELLRSGVFITFPGNCRKALTFYQSCFGGTLHFEMLDSIMGETLEVPVVNGFLMSQNIIIHGSDMVHDEGRTIGNYVAVFFTCRNAIHRKALVNKLTSLHNLLAPASEQDKLIEVTDVFDVRWILAV